MIDVPIRVRDALKEGSYLKNWKIDVYSPDDLSNALFTIDNNNLVEESVAVDERMCTGKELKFGLCEGSMIEFKYFDYPNINGNRIKVVLEVQYENASGSLEWYPLPIGWFDVKSCPMEFDTGVMKAKAYNKLQSDYLDQKANHLIEEISAEVDGKVSIYTIINKLLDDYTIEQDDKTRVWKNVSTDANEDYIRIEMYKNATGNEKDTRYIVYHTYTETFPRYSWEAESGYYKFVYEEVPWCAPTDWSGTPFGFIECSDGKRMHINEFLKLPYTEQTNLNSLVAVASDKVRGNLLKGVINPKIQKMAESGYTYIEQDSGTYSITYTHIVSITAYEPSRRKPTIYEPYPVNVYMRKTSKAEENRYTKTELSNWADVTLRELQSAVFEMSCQFGRLDRVTDLFAGLELNGSRLLPSDSLYPSDDLYPISTSERSDPSSYEKLWTDSAGVQNYKYLIITYKAIGEDGQEVEKTLQRTIHEHGTTNYNMSDNWLFKNLVWTAEQVGEYADAMVEKMRNVSWIPFEMWSAGLPYLEPGDELEISNKEGTFASYILQRKLKGIQNLTDEMINGELDIF